MVNANDHVSDTHSLLVGYLLVDFGFLGAHRFYFGRPISGTVYLFTFGLLGIGWIVDLFLMPKLKLKQIEVLRSGPINYTAAWVLLVFVGPLGLHRFYLGKPLTGLLYLLTFGVFLLGVIYDWWTMNQQISDANIARRYY